jgi:hypothetical protein
VANDMAKIDLEGMARLVRGLEDVAQYLPGIRNEFVTTLNRFSLPRDTTASLAHVAGWAQDSLPGVRRRLALAREIEAQSPGWQGPVTIDESTISTMDPAEAQQAGADAALALLDGSGVPDAELLAQLEEMSGDPYFAAGFAKELSPEQLAEVVTRLSGSRRPLDGSQTYEENLATNAWYDKVLVSMSRTLATATHSTGDLALPSDYGRSWVQAITAELPTDTYGDGSGTARYDQAAALGLLLGSGGRFEEAVVSTVAEGVYAYERSYGDEHGGKVWYPRSSGAQVAGAGIYDPSTTGMYVDPMVGVMNAVALHPELAARFLNPDGGGPKAQSRAEYLIGDRTWGQDDFDAIARVLDAGGTVWHTTEATRAQQEQSAWIASATVHHLAERDGGRHDRRIGEAGKDSLGHLLGAYIADIDTVAQGRDAVTVPGVTSGDYTTASWLAGLPVGAEFQQGDLNKVLSEVLTDDVAAVRLAEATAQFNAARVSAAVGEYDADPAVGISGPLGSSSRLVGYLAGNLEQGSVKAGKEVDERNEQFIGLTSDLVGLIPTGQTLTSFLADQAKSAGKDWVTEELTGNAAAATAKAQSDAEATTLSLQIAAAVALADSPHLPDSVRTDHNGKVYPWFQEGASAEAALTDPEVRGLFIQWMHDDAGAIAEHLPDVGKMFDQGRDWGRG